MSWEDHEFREPCPCGKGSIVTRARSDDWGRYESSGPVIECDSCSKDYVFWTPPSCKERPARLISRENYERLLIEKRQHEERVAEERVAQDSRDEQVRDEVVPALLKALSSLNSRRKLLEALKPLINSQAPLWSMAHWDRRLKSEPREDVVRALVSERTRAVAVKLAGLARR